MQKMQAQDDFGTVIMGYQLGAHHDSLDMHGLLKMGKFQQLLRYDLQGEKLNMDGIDLQHVRLFFWDSHLHSVEVKTAEGQAEKMLVWIKAMYGEGKKSDAMGYQYKWLEPLMRVIYEQNLLTKVANVNFVDEATNNKYFKFMYNKAYAPQ
jgi:hypothetical protein